MPKSYKVNVRCLSDEFWYEDEKKRRRLVTKETISEEVKKTITKNIDNIRDLLSRTGEVRDAGLANGSFNHHHHGDDKQGQNHQSNLTMRKKVSEHWNRNIQLGRNFQQ